MKKIYLLFSLFIVIITDTKGQQEIYSDVKEIKSVDYQISVKTRSDVWENYQFDLNNSSSIFMDFDELDSFRDKIEVDLPTDVRKKSNFDTVTKILQDTINSLIKHYGLFNKVLSKQALSFDDKIVPLEAQITKLFLDKDSIPGLKVRFNEKTMGVPMIPVVMYSRIFKSLKASESNAQSLYDEVNRIYDTWLSEVNKEEVKNLLVNRQLLKIGDTTYVLNITREVTKYRKNKVYLTQLVDPDTVSGPMGKPIFSVNEDALLDVWEEFLGANLFTQNKNYLEIIAQDIVKNTGENAEKLDEQKKEEESLTWKEVYSSSFSFEDSTYKLIIQRLAVPPANFRFIIAEDIADNPDSAKFQLNDLNTLKLFNTEMAKAMGAIKDTDLSDSQEKSLSEETSEKFFEAKLKLILEASDAPLAGNIIVKEVAESKRRAYTASKEWHRWKRLHKKDYGLLNFNKFGDYKESIQEEEPREFKIDSVEIEFFEGAIKNIIVVGNLKPLNQNKPQDHEKHLIYRNTRPIAFSELNDFSKLEQVELIPFHSNSYAIKLSHVITYKPKLHLFSEDYSPKDTVQVFKPTIPGNVELHKENTLNILKARVYTDFIGLSEGSPNGLIQTEVSKKIILNPSRYSRARHRVHKGFFNYIEPNITLSKIEENERDLPLSVKFIDSLITETMVVMDTMINQMDTTITDRIEATGRQAQFSESAMTLDLLRRSNFNFGAKLNLGVVDVRRWKSSYYLNFGANYYRTSVKDSIRLDESTRERATTKNINLLGIYFEGLWDIKPDPRFGISLSGRIMRFKRLNKNFFQITRMSKMDDLLQLQQDLVALRNEASLDADIDNETEITDLEDEIEEFRRTKEDKPWLYSLHLDAVLRPSPKQKSKGELFFRASYFSALTDATQNFMQVQLGYSFFILKR